MFVVEPPVQVILMTQEGKLSSTQFTVDTAHEHDLSFRNKFLAKFDWSEIADVLVLAAQQNHADHVRTR